MESLSVIVPTYRRPRELADCLRSLREGGTAGLRQVLVVVYEGDAEGERVARRWEREWELLRVVHTRERSRSAARNAAVPLCEGDWCWFLDDDVVLPPGTVSVLQRTLASEPEADVVGGPNLVPPDAGPFERVVDAVLRSPLGAWRMRSRYAGHGGRRWVDERSLISCNLAVRTAALKGAPGFHEWLDYGEETLLLARMRLAGRRMLYAPGLRVYHRRRTTWSGFLKQAFRSGAGRARQTLLLPRSLSPAFLGPPALVVVWATAYWIPASAAALAVYAAACAVQGARIGVSMRSAAAGLKAAVLLPAAHTAFGAGFCVFPVVRPWPPAVLRSLGALRRGLGGWVLRLAAVPPLKALWTLYYRAALRAVRVWCQGFERPARELWLRRGFAGEDWRPGASDIDLAVEIPELPFAEESAWMRRWHSGYGRLRRLFPVLGEVQLATRAEWRSYLRFGDERASELPFEIVHSLRNGTAAVAPDPWDAAKRDVDLWSEQLHAYVRLAQLCFEKGESPARLRRHAVKAVLDTARYGDRIPAGRLLPQRALPRAAARATVRGTELEPALERLERAETAAEIREAVDAALGDCAAALDRTARAVFTVLPAADPVGPAPEAGPAPFGELGILVEVVGELNWATGGAVQCAVHDTAHHFLVGVNLPDGADDRADLVAGIRSVRRWQVKLSGTLLPLTPAALKLFLWSPRGEDPLKALSLLSAGGGKRWGAAVSGSGSCLNRHVVSIWDVPPGVMAPPPRPLAQRLMRESLTHLWINWRSMGADGHPEPAHYRWTYLYSRVMSLSLHARTGEIFPMFPLEPLARRFAEVFPEEASWVAERVLAAPAPGDWAEDEAFFARRLREAAACPT